MEATAAPIDGTVNIPLAELSTRTHELPPRDEVIPVVGSPELAAQTVAWLAGHGRRGVVQSEFRFARGACRQIGRLWRPNALLAEIAPQLQPGRALDLACGTGRDAVFLAACGWTVMAVDILDDALERGRALARQCAAAIVPIDWRDVDLEQGDPTAQLDPPFDLIVGFRYLHRPLLARLADWLRTGGNVLYETFTTEHRARHGKPADDRHVLQPGELRTLLTGLTVRYYSEAWRGNVHTARIWATRP